MGTITNNAKMTCYLCDNKFDRSEIKIVIGQTIYLLCKKCSKELEEQKNIIERSLQKRRNKLLKIWMKETRVVKRLYKNQLQLPIGENKNED